MSPELQLLKRKGTYVTPPPPRLERVKVAADYIMVSYVATVVRNVVKIHVETVLKFHI